MAAGTAFAISYQVCQLAYKTQGFPSTFFQSDIKKVTEENLVVFSVKYQYVLLKHRR